MVPFLWKEEVYYAFNFEKRQLNMICDLRQRWFSADYKSFEFMVEGEGRKTQVIITERRRGQLSWIRFSEVGARILLKGVGTLRRETNKNSRGLEWRENGRRYSLELQKNDVERFLICSVVDADGKRHRLFFSEGNGLINGWTLVVEVLQDMGTKVRKGEKRKPDETNLHSKVEIYKDGQINDQSFAEITISGRINQDMVWLDISDCIPKGDLGLLKHGVVGRWKSQPTIDPLLT